ncbi:MULTISPECIES: mechanosensitive ion channel family protein [unclassified Undibacterium]|uniref:mechanosensitive ion channel family protein n=1 Tax=unclassified Undibacterium TaxID=2630295 RepID=UPI002AC8E7CD|nr:MULTISPECIES: mechanosensitive ion channel domain-containing protein [unclassified Undibacterium]MEB0141044.1 mechanosensitive ion channel [Undibacterium sp. CCC2.1]MEB0170534.1 mechanosensitive ion channel [Undibacterium sp. CCC1.1]MEB0174475.1 mechanosensitive ion channel [Undibacterium sp. CCC3.4]MEB0213728.1 mechanosensitive ion channel [Undibacterium sp. 5I2]WPX43892.1 mechanosensitive ion channel [Undibacterium sp. CCC3.4]
MTTETLTTLITDLGTDFREPQFLWQVATVLLCVGLTWLCARAVRYFLVKGQPSSAVVQLGVASFSRVLEPALCMLFLLAGRAILSQWQHTHLFAVLFPILGSLVLIRFGFYVFRKTFVRSGQVGSFLQLVEKLFAGLVWLVVLLHFSGVWPELLTALDEIVLPLGKNKISLLNILEGCISVALTMVVALWASAALEARLMLLPNAHSSLKVVLSRLGRAFLIVLAILVSLTIVGIDLTVLSVFGGALGVGLGFGLQKIASSYVSGFIILFDRSMAIGDMITVDKFSGTVTQINTRYTVVQSLDGAESVIPNEMLVSTPVQNFSLSSRRVAVSADVTVAYDTEVEALLPLLVQVASGVERVLADPAPSSYLMKFGADGFELRVSFWIADPENGRSNVLSGVNRAIWKLVVEQKVCLPYPQRVVTLINEAKPAVDTTVNQL